MHVCAGTIPDSVALSGEAAEPDIVDGIPAAVAAAALPELHPWDQYFDEVQDLQLEDRGGTFRHVPAFKLLHAMLTGA
jgi:hypothetical protein